MNNLLVLSGVDSGGSVSVFEKVRQHSWNGSNSVEVPYRKNFVINKGFGKKCCM